MGADSNVCGLCAFDKRKGIQSSTLVRTVDAGDGERGRRIVACKECGYDLSGLPTAKCPECGTNNIRKHDLLEGVSEETEQAAFRTPIIAIAVGFGVTFGVVGIAWGQAGLLASLILLALTLPVALVVVSLCLIIWIGVDSTWKLTLLQITGAAALSVLGVCVCAGLAAVFGFPSGMAIVPCMVIGFFCLIASLAWMLDLELTDAALTGVFTSIIIIGELLLLWTR